MAERVRWTPPIPRPRAQLGAFPVVIAAPSHKEAEPVARALTDVGVHVLGVQVLPGEFVLTEDNYAIDVFHSNRHIPPRRAEWRYIVLIPLMVVPGSRPIKVTLHLPSRILRNTIILFIGGPERAVEWPFGAPLDYGFSPGDDDANARAVARLLGIEEVEHGRDVTRRMEPLDARSAGALLSAAESLLAEAQTVLDDTPAGVSDEDLVQLQGEVTVFRTLLQLPSGDTVRIERTLARIAQLLSKLSPDEAALQQELLAGWVDDTAAAQLARDLTLVQQQVALLGEEDATADVSIARALSEIVERIDATVAGLQARATDEPDEKSQIRKAKLDGRVKFWAEVWPEQKAKAVVAATTLAVGASVTSNLGIPGAILRVARTVVTTLFS